MKIFARASNFDLKIAKATQTVSQAWFVFSKPIIVGNANVINSTHESIFFFMQELF